MDRFTVTLGALLAGLGLAACQQGTDNPPASPPSPATGQAADAAPGNTVLVDVIQTSPEQVIGISYPHGKVLPAGLATVLRDYADQARQGLQEALDALGNDSPRVPYELSLSFTVTADTPAMIAVSADGSRYTGGAHGEPLMARFVWLQQEQRLLSVDELITAPASRQAVAAYVENVLIEQLDGRLRADKLEAAELRQARENATAMISQGTEPEAENFRQFQPIINRQGRMTALRFVFPPYQVGPYSDGTQHVDVPVQWLRPHLSPAWLHLFADSVPAGADPAAN